MNIQKFKETALPMWVKKCKTNSGTDVRLEGDRIYDYGIDKVIVQFNDNHLYLLGDTQAEIPYVDDELQFIKNIEKAAKQIKAFNFKNLKALRDNIKLLKFEKYQKYLNVFDKYNKIYRSSKANEIFNISCIPISELRTYNEPIFTFDYAEVGKVKPKIVSFITKGIHQATGFYTEDPEGNRYLVEVAFRTKNEAILAVIWHKLFRIGFVVAYERNTKAGKVQFVDSVDYYLKTKKLYKEVEEINTIIDNHPEYFL